MKYAVEHRQVGEVGGDVTWRRQEAQASLKQGRMRPSV